jgi:hypothetical protein
MRARNRDALPERPMTKRAIVRLSDVRGIHLLANDATVAVADLVESMHATILGTPSIIVGRPPRDRTRGITGFVYRSVRGIARLVGESVDAALHPLAGAIDARASSPRREATLAALNGVLGDYLHSTGNPLAIEMSFRSGGARLELSRSALAAAFPRKGNHLVVLVHGLCMNDLQWMRNGHDHGAALARDLGCTPVRLHYNTGRHISENGRDFAERMEALVREWPHPIAQLTVIGHSMGGLVARSACHYASRAGHAWTRHLDNLVFLGTPHFGAPLERAGTLADLLIGISPYSAPFVRIGRVRSAGIRDLGHAWLVDEDWQARRDAATGAGPALPLPPRVRSFAIAASLQKRRGAVAARLRGDGLVPVDSALGRSRDAARDLALPEKRRWVGLAMGHLDLLDRQDAYARMRDWLAERPRRKAAGPR